jgi:hypothetical protein
MGEKTAGIFATKLLTSEMRHGWAHAGISEHNLAAGRCLFCGIDRSCHSLMG